MKNLVVWDSYSIAPQREVVNLRKSEKIALIDSMVQGESSKGLEIKFLLSSSDRLTNSRIYRAAAQQVGAKSWTEPYPIPIIRNHDANEEPLGRISDVEWISNDSEAQGFFRSSREYLEFLANSRDASPTGLYKLMKRHNLLDNPLWPGTGYLRATARIMDEDAIIKFMDGRYLTFSAGASTDQFVCGICGSKWHDGDVCEHRPSTRDEDGNLSAFVMGAYVGKEASVVNQPANNRSMIQSMRLSDSMVDAGASEAYEIQTGDLPTGQWQIADGDIDSLVEMLMARSTETPDTKDEIMDNQDDVAVVEDQVTPEAAVEATPVEAELADAEVEVKDAPEAVEAPEVAAEAPEAEVLEDAADVADAPEAVEAPVAAAEVAVEDADEPAPEVEAVVEDVAPEADVEDKADETVVEAATEDVVADEVVIEDAAVTEEVLEATDVEAEESVEDRVNYKVPAGAKGNAQKVLDWRDKYKDEVKGMTSVGWRRARQLATEETVSLDVVKRMAAFNRHRKNSEIAPEFKDTPWKDAGYVAWLGWGGTTGVDWARGITGADKRTNDSIDWYALDCLLQVEQGALLSDDDRDQLSAAAFIGEDRRFALTDADSCEVAKAVVLKANLSDEDSSDILDRIECRLEELAPSLQSRFDALMEDYERVLVRVQELEASVATKSVADKANVDAKLDTVEDASENVSTESVLDLVDTVENPSAAGGSAKESKENLGAFQRQIVNKYCQVKDTRGIRAANAFIAHQKSRGYIDSGFNVSQYLDSTE